MVSNKTIDAKILSRMFLAGAKNLEAKKEWINELNVFPVPDGDTGTNMTMTIMSAAFLRLPAGRQRKFRRYPFAASQRFYKKRQKVFFPGRPGYSGRHGKSGGNSV